MWEIKLFRIYSKFFGGKIWLNLHIVFPQKIFDKKFKMVSLKIFRQKLSGWHLVQNFQRNNFLTESRSNFLMQN